MPSEPRRLGALLISALMLCVSAPALAEETCVQCHSQLRDPRLRQPTDELPASVHGKQGVRCSDCHHGRPDEPTVKAHDITKGFRARVAANDPEAVCGTCHADPKIMASHDASVPTDQLDLYKTSVHGIAFAKGNQRAATCATCHGSHAVRKVGDPQASVNPRNVATTCGHCHSDPELMTPLKMPHDQEQKWRRSVHGQRHAAWLASRPPGTPVPDSERHPPTCNDCHKDHGIGPRDKAIAGCEGCHEDKWKSFAAGPHAKAFARMGFLPCVDCHGSHEILQVTSGLIGADHEAACIRCHAKGQRMFDDIRKLSTQVRAAEDAAQSAREAQSGVPVAMLAARLRPVDEAQHALRLVVHTLDLKQIATAARELAMRAAAVPRGAPEAHGLLSDTGSQLPALLLLIAGALALFFGLRRRGGGEP
jgi:hypothetical protein